MLYPLDTITKVIGGLLDKTKIPGEITKGLDSIGSEVLPSNNEKKEDLPTPRLIYPKILFFWGVKRILPVILKEITITEKQFDGSLNPTRAEVRIGLTVNKDLADTDVIAWGAYKLTMLTKEAQALLNVVSKIDLPPELTTVIPF